MLYDKADGKHAIVICPDYDEWGYSLSEDVPPFSIASDGRIDNKDIYDLDGKPIVMPELYEWQKEIEPIVVAFSVGEPYDKDWADYHRRGLYIAHKLRQVLSPDFDLWYEAPLEDRSRTIPQMLLISQSKNVLICENLLGELEIITDPNKIKRIQDDQEKREWVTLPSGIKVGLLTNEEKTKLKERVKASMNPKFLEGLREARERYYRQQAQKLEK